MSELTVPAIAGVHHISLTVSDIETSLAWYQRLLGAERVPMKFPHYEREEKGFGVLLVEPRSGLMVGLHTNTANEGERFDEARTGLDHIGLGVGTREDLQAWTAWLGGVGIETSGITGGGAPIPSLTWG